MRLQDAAAINSLPRSYPTVDAAVRMQEAFPGTPVPAQIVVWRQDGGQADTPALRQAIEGLHGQITASGGLLAEPFTVDRVDRAVVVRIPVAGSSTDETSVRALRYLRGVAVPSTVGAVPGVTTAVAGKTAQVEDFNVKLRANSWMVFMFVLLLAFVLMVFVFRSLAVPVVSVIVNLLSIGAAYGVVTWVFQGGHLSGLLHFTPYGGVMSWLPLFMFVVLFGLSMDYHIFILSRIRERWTSGATARDAVISGISSSAGVVTSAAVIMTVVFSVFITLTSIENKMLGVGLAVAVMIDATIVRGVLVPAALALLGERAWAVPRWLRWLPGEPERPGQERGAVPL
jgi:RND superfamily putative drug exporter